MTHTLLSLGHGYAAAAAVTALPRGWQVLATTRDPDRARTLAAQGLEPVLWTEPGALPAALARASHLLISTPPGPEGCPALAALADAPAPALRWAGYLSASSVHGDSAGAWVTDLDPARPDSPRGRARLAAEEGWEAWCAARGAGLARIRVAGIYGPGRSVFEQIAAGRARRIEKPGQVFNRIHVADLGAIIAAAATRMATGPILAADGAPAPPQDLLDHACDLMGRPRLPTLPFETADISPMARSFYSESKRLRPTRLAELGVTLRYPSWREGLAALGPGA